MELTTEELLLTMPLDDLLKEIMKEGQCTRDAAMKRFKNYKEKKISIDELFKNHKKSKFSKIEKSESLEKQPCLQKEILPMSQQTSLCSSKCSDSHHHSKIDLKSLFIGSLWSILNKCQHIKSNDIEEIFEQLCASHKNELSQYTKALSMTLEIFENFIEKQNTE